MASSNDIPPERLISYNVANLINDRNIIANYSTDYFSDNMYLMYSHGTSSAYKKLEPIKLRDGEQVIITCIDGCVAYLKDYWPVAMKSIDTENLTIGNPNYKTDIINFLKINPSYKKSLCVFESKDELPEIIFEPKDENIRMGLYQMPLTFNFDSNSKIRHHKIMQMRGKNFKNNIKSNITLKNLEKNYIRNIPSTNNFYTSKMKTSRYLEITSFKKYDNWQPTSAEKYLLLSQIIKDIRAKIATEQKNNSVTDNKFTLIVLSCRYEPRLLPASYTFRKFITPNGYYSRPAIDTYLSSNNYQNRTTNKNIPFLKQISTIFKQPALEIKNKDLLKQIKKYIKNEKLDYNKLSNKDKILFLKKPQIILKLFMNYNFEKITEELNVNKYELENEIDNLAETFFIYLKKNKGILILDEILTNNKPISNLNFALQNFLNFFYSFIAKSREYHEKLQNENEYESLLFYQLINNFKAVLEKIGAVWNISSAINTTAKELGYY